ncbi:hypothetical protein G5714_020176 [Onychostoma macrolepis]|uniref:Uncharacterized protein n=1 Tax=Onychostoma macrolepis TaxID=369639 RepID=A0A7J6BT48_9TELE|nr:hypothetical protein G5714_020176 [Onychostoma macrolepis]
MNVGGSEPSHLTSSAHRHISLDVESAVCLQQKLAEQLSRKEDPITTFFYSLKEIIQLGEDLTSRNSSRITQLFCQTRL